MMIENLLHDGEVAQIAQNVGMKYWWLNYVQACVQCRNVNRARKKTIPNPIILVGQQDSHNHGNLHSLHF